MSGGNGAPPAGAAPAGGETRVVLQAAFWLGGLFAPPRGRRCAVCGEHALSLELRNMAHDTGGGGPAVVGVCPKCVTDRAIVTFVAPGEACWRCKAVADVPATSDPDGAVRLCAHFNNVREGSRLVLAPGGGPRAAG